MNSKNKTIQLVFSSILCLFIACKSPELAYKPRFEKNWNQVDSTIRKNWVNKSCKGSKLPNAFAYAFYCNTQFYWDTYFTQLGLIKHNEIELCKGGANNFIYLIDSLGFIPNANEPWGSNRSQPPYFSMMVKDLYATTQDKKWLESAYHALLKEYAFWADPMNKIEDNHTSIIGLLRFYNHASVAELLTMYDHELTKRFEFPAEKDTTKRIQIAQHFASEAETGMDFTPRFEGRCGDFAAVDLNCLVYLMEQNFAWIEKELSISDGKIWTELAISRKNLINQYFWNEERGLYLDYDFVNKRHSKVASATTFSPLYAGIADKEKAQRVTENLKLFLGDYGVSTTEFSEQKIVYQWDHSSAWPPMQTITLIGLDNYGYKKEALEVAMKYLDLVSKNFISPDPPTFKDDKGIQERRKGEIYEKYLINGKLNDREYKANYMYGWSAGTYAYFYDYYLKNKALFSK